MSFILPSIIKNSKGDIRKTGFEIEYSGITLKDCASIIIELFGGKIYKESIFKIEIANSKFGDFVIYIDSKLLRELENLKIDKFLEKEEENIIKEAILSLSEIVVPYEIVTPPIPFYKLDNIEKLREELKKRGALGTNASIFFAFGLHINIEVPSFKVDDILDIFRAFLIFYEWIKEREKIDPTRKLTWFIDPFEKRYIQKVIDMEYRPTLKEFCDDYIFYNPTRNRALDLLPLLSYIDNSILEKLPDEKINPRPAFHYRLPNSRIDEENWSISKEFNLWSMIEKLAFEKEKLYGLCKEYFEFLDSPLWFVTSLWIEKVDKFINENYKEYI